MNDNKKTTGLSHYRQQPEASRQLNADNLEEIFVSPISDRSSNNTPPALDSPLLGPSMSLFSHPNSFQTQKAEKTSTTGNNYLDKLRSQIMNEKGELVSKMQDMFRYSVQEVWPRTSTGLKLEQSSSAFRAAEDCHGIFLPFSLESSKKYHEIMEDGEAAARLQASMIAMSRAILAAMFHLDAYLRSTTEETGISLVKLEFYHCAVVYKSLKNDISENSSKFRSILVEFVLNLRNDVTRKTCLDAMVILYKSSCDALEKLYQLRDFLSTPGKASLTGSGAVTPPMSSTSGSINAGPSPLSASNIWYASMIPPCESIYAKKSDLERQSVPQKTDTKTRIPEQMFESVPSGSTFSSLPSTASTIVDENGLRITQTRKGDVVRVLVQNLGEKKILVTNALFSMPTVPMIPSHVISNRTHTDKGKEALASSHLPKAGVKGSVVADTDYRSQSESQSHSQPQSQSQSQPRSPNLFSRRETQSPNGDSVVSVGSVDSTGSGRSDKSTNSTGSATSSNSHQSSRSLLSRASSDTFTTPCSKSSGPASFNLNGLHGGVSSQDADGNVSRENILPLDGALKRWSDTMPLSNYLTPISVRKKELEDQGKAFSPSYIMFTFNLETVGVNAFLPSNATNSVANDSKSISHIVLDGEDENGDDDDENKGRSGNGSGNRSENETGEPRKGESDTDTDTKHYSPDENLRSNHQNSRRNRTSSSIDNAMDINTHMNANDITPLKDSFHSRKRARLVMTRKREQKDIFRTGRSSLDIDLDLDVDADADTETGADDNADNTFDFDNDSRRRSLNREDSHHHQVKGDTSDNSPCFPPLSSTSSLWKSKFQQFHDTKQGNGSENGKGKGTMEMDPTLDFKLDKKTPAKAAQNRTQNATHTTKDSEALVCVSLKMTFL